jgi:hypothetical protein
MYRGCLTGIPVDDLRCFAKRQFSSLKAFLMSAQRDERNPEVNISTTQALLAMAIGLCSAGPLVSILVRYWLFAP